MHKLHQGAYFSRKAEEGSSVGFEEEEGDECVRTRTTLGDSHLGEVEQQLTQKV